MLDIDELKKDLQDKEEENRTLKSLLRMAVKQKLSLAERARADRRSGSDMHLDTQTDSSEKSSSNDSLEQINKTKMYYQTVDIH